MSLSCTVSEIITTCLKIGSIRDCELPLKVFWFEYHTRNGRAMDVSNKLFKVSSSLRMHACESSEQPLPLASEEIRSISSYAYLSTVVISFKSTIKACSIFPDVDHSKVSIAEVIYTSLKATQDHWQ